MSVEFGAVLRTVRARAGLTRRQLAEQAGCHASYVSVLEHGKRGAPSEQMCVVLARACGVSADVLLVAAKRMPAEMEGVAL